METITISDFNAGTFTFTNTTADVTGTPSNVTYVIAENVTLTNS